MIRIGIPTSGAFPRRMTARASQFGALTAQLAHQGRSGRMVALRNGQITVIDLVDIQGKARQVALDDHGLRTARSLGICLGDRYDTQRELEE